jgi:copper(I)-binding protein
MNLLHLVRCLPTLTGALVLVSASVQASERASCVGAICVEQAWARAMPGGAQNAAVYLSIVNKGTVPDELRATSAEAAASAMIHRSTVGANNVVRMEMAGAVELAPGTRLTFAPAGYHVMLGRMKQRLIEGMTIPITLEFARAGKLTVPVHVLGVAATGPGRAAQSGGTPPVPGAGHAHH